MDPITGETTAAVLSPTGIPADPPLTAHGVDQSNELAAHLAALEPPIDAVYSSPYYRCLQTISPFVALRNDHSSRAPARGSAAAPLTIRPEKGLSEFYGVAPFDHPVPAETSFLKKLFPAVDAEYRSRVVPPRKGESIEALYQRVRSAVENVIEQCDAEGHRAVVLCTHAAVVIALGRVLTGNIPEAVDVDDFGAYTCGVSVFRRPKTDSRPESREQDETAKQPDAKAAGNGCARTSHDSSGAKAEARRTGNWICDANSDCSFLSGGQERGWYVLKVQEPTLSSLLPYSSPPARPSLRPPHPFVSIDRLVNASDIPSASNPPYRTFSGDEAFALSSKPSPGTSEDVSKGNPSKGGQAGSPRL